MMDKYVVFDVGGSSIKYALMDGQANLIDKDKVATPKSDFSDFQNQLLAIINNYNKEDNLKGIAFSCPGAVDTKTGIIGGASAVPYIHGPNFKEIFREKTGLKVSIENDANCAALAEVWKGAAKENQDLLFVVIGTGIGGAIIKDRKIHKGAHLHGGEFGFSIMQYDFEAEEFVNWSRVASTNSLVERVARMKAIDVDTIDGEYVFAEAAKGDPECLKALDSYYSYLALGIYNLQYIYDPELIVIGGGVSAQPMIIDKINQKVKAIMAQQEIATIIPQLRCCEYQNDANLIGALYNHLFDD